MQKGDQSIAGSKIGGIKTHNSTGRLYRIFFWYGSEPYKIWKGHSDSRAFERAIREIYIKQFEIIVKEDHPWSIMSSYNIINGHRVSEYKDMLTGILRDEWGFDGMVTTDWWTYGEHYKEVMAGNDMKMAVGYPDRLLDAKEKGVLTHEAMETAAKNVLTLIIRID